MFYTPPLKWGIIERYKSRFEVGHYWTILKLSIMEQLPLKWGIIELINKKNIFSYKMGRDYTD